VTTLPTRPPLCSRRAAALAAAAWSCLALAGPALAKGDPACGRRCATLKHACLLDAKDQRSTERAACFGRSDERSCAGGALASFRGTVRACRETLVACRACCRRGGSASSCQAPASCAGGEAYASTWAAIQGAIFERHGCTQQICHGTAASGGLRLTPDVAYRSLVEAASQGSALRRVEPGDQRRSFLWQKLAAKTDPAQLPPGAQVGTPMPNVGAAVSPEALEALRLWIYAGAPESGNVIGTESLLGACLPAPEPLRIAALRVPAKGEGVQLPMPTWPLPKQSEREVCFATYFDISGQVPKEFQDPTGQLFRFDAQELRQDPQSHHLILNFAVLDESQVNDQAFGAWRCMGGRRNGRRCQPTVRGACGKKGTCTSEIKPSFACIGFGPRANGRASFPVPIGGAQKSQNFQRYHEGVFAQIPMKGFLYWNSHAFNLTARDSTMHAWLNYYFARDPRYGLGSIFNISKIFGAKAAPFTEETLCNDHVLPQGAQLFSLSSHTHKRGKRFWVTGPDGTLLYENFVYNDPPNKIFDPPLVFDAPAAADRTLRYCALFNNGVRPDGSPDVEFVTRRSRTPDSALAPCDPVACVSGKVGASCGGPGASHDRECDSAPGANDGFCDACPITGGESTENEMFILMGQFFGGGRGRTGGAGPTALALGADGDGLDANGRSTSSEIHAPAIVGCSSAGPGHAGHLGH
jgi:hypothetical protein